MVPTPTVIGVGMEPTISIEIINFTYLCTLFTVIIILYLSGQQGKSQDGALRVNCSNALQPDSSRILIRSILMADSFISSFT